MEDLKLIIRRIWIGFVPVFLPFLFLFHLPAAAQVQIVPKGLNFGNTSPVTQWVVDVHITNKGSRKDFLLRTTFSHEYEVLFTSKTLLPDSSITMRIKFMPRLKGNFSEDIELYFASMDKPIIFSVRAVVDYMNPDDNIPCPDFSRLAADCCPENMFMVEVVDAATQKPIEKATVKLIENGIQRMKIETPKDGKVAQNISIGYYDLVASHPAYSAKTITSYVNHHKAYFRFELEKKVITEPEVAVENPQPVDTMITVEKLPPPATTNAILPEDKFRPNNVVFLLDVSQSMSQGNKLELMKGALKELSIVLRPIDKITLISYADDARTILPTTSGDNKNTILQIVEEVHAAGSTSGAKGFRASYEVLKKEFIAGGNNQLVVVTDGAFQPADQEDINKLVKKSVRKNLTTTIVGIQCAPFAVQKLTELSIVGNGSFLPISDEEDLNIFIEELKKRSAR